MSFMDTPVSHTTPTRSKLLGRVSDVAVLLTNKQKITTTESTCLFLGHGSVNVVVWSVICCHGSGGRYLSEGASPEEYLGHNLHMHCFEDTEIVVPYQPGCVAAKGL